MKSAKGILQKTAVLFTVFVTCLVVLTGCNVETPKQRQQRLSNKASESQPAQSTSCASTDSAITADDYILTKDLQQSQQESKKSTEKSNIKTSNIKNISTDKSMGTKSSKQEVSTKATESKAKENTSTTNKEQEQTVTCSITVSAKELFDNKDKIQNKYKEQTLKYLTESDIIKHTQVSIKKGSTVFDVLKKQCDKTGIKLDYKGSAFSVYISGINNIYEKICGGSEGWTYYVNGKMINASSSAAIIKEGDEIVWKYSVK